MTNKFHILLNQKKLSNNNGNLQVKKIDIYDVLSGPVKNTVEDKSSIKNREFKVLKITVLLTNRQILTL